MPLEDLLAFYGYESTIPTVANSSANSSPSELADELPDMTLDKVSTSLYKKVLGSLSLTKFFSAKASSNSEMETSCYFDDCFEHCLIALR